MGARHLPDRRAVSKRWLAGTVLTGTLSCLLMGMALTISLDGVAASTAPDGLNASGRGGRMIATERKTDRLLETVIAPGSSDRQLIEVPTLVQDGDRAVARTVSLMRVRMPLGLAYADDREYPAYDPLRLLADMGDSSEAVNPTQFYGANIESDVALRTLPLDAAMAEFDQSAALSDIEVEQIVRLQSASLTEGDIQIAAMAMFDQARFGTADAEAQALDAVNVRITTENVSQASAQPGVAARFNEVLIDVVDDKRLARALADAGLGGKSADNISEAMATLLKGDTLREGQKLRISAYMQDDGPDIRRLSIYDGVVHRATVALDDLGQYVPAAEPEEIVMTLEDEAEPIGTRVASSNLPSAYDAIYRAAFAYGLNETMAKRLVQMLSQDLELRERVGASDAIEVLFTEPAPDMTATEESAILMAELHQRSGSKRFYRFETADGVAAYYDADGVSAQQGMLRNPVPTGTFRSGFGMRRHPILGYKRMHTGADWSAPRGTPIIAVGNGIVEKAGWAGGYGKQTLIRHPNGYISSYSHQNSIAKGVTPGAKVRQGQIIGTVGSTGLSTGPHLHYEIIVNGNKVDPMRVRLPGGRILKDRELDRFQTVRAEIDRLMAEQTGRAVAALN
jgi:murein DD-endopeptidase MepM/ murein hydrolase activator NlpD